MNMKITVKHLLVLLGLCAVLPICEAQNTVVRRSSTANSSRAGQSGLTTRAKTLYQTEAASEADVPWSRSIYRQIDLTQEKNMPLYYPEEVIDGQENLFRVLLGLVATNKITVYEYLDGREIFTEEYEVKVEDMLERFHILYELKAGRTAKRNTYIIEESDVPCNEVLSYYVKEKWIFDQRSSTCYPVIEAICPVLHRVGDFYEMFGDEAVEAAKALIEADGYTMNESTGFYEKDGQTLSLTISTYAKRSLDTLAILMQEQFKALGIDAQIKIEDNPESTYLSTKDFEVGLYTAITDKAGEPFTFLNQIKKDEWLDVCGFGNDETDALIEELRYETDEDKKSELADQIMTQFYESNCFVSLGQYIKTTAIRTGAGGLGETNPLQFYAISAESYAN